MCYAERAHERTIDAAGQARQRLLQIWVKADHDRSVLALTESLRHWRDDVVKRISEDRPQKIRIPMIFMNALGLRSQLVLLDADDSVKVLEDVIENHYILGRVLVLGKNGSS